MSDFIADAIAALDGSPAPAQAEAPAEGGAAPLGEISEDVLSALDPEVKEEVASEEGKEEAKEEPKEEEEPAVKPEEVATIQQELEESKAKFEKQTKALQKRLKAEGDAKRALEMKIQDLQGEGIEMARDIAQLAKKKDIEGIFKKFGFTGDDVVDMYKPYLGGEEGAEKIKEAKWREEKRQADLKAQEDQRVAQRQALKTTAVGVVNKYAEKVPVFAALDAITGGSTVDQLLTDIGVMYQRRDPDIVGCQTFEEAVKKVLPMKEKEARRQYKAIVEAFSRAEASKAAKVEPKEVKKPEEKKPEAKSAKVEPKVEAKPKPVARGNASSVGASSSKAPQSKQDFIEDALRMLP